MADIESLIALVLAGQHPKLIARCIVARIKTVLEETFGAYDAAAVRAVLVDRRAEVDAELAKIEAAPPVFLSLLAANMNDHDASGAATSAAGASVDGSSAADSSSSAAGPSAAGSSTRTQPVTPEGGAPGNKRKQREAPSSTVPAVVDDGKGASSSMRCRLVRSKDYHEAAAAGKGEAEKKLEVEGQHKKLAELKSHRLVEDICFRFKDMYKDVWGFHDPHKLAEMCVEAMVIFGLVDELTCEVDDAAIKKEGVLDTILDQLVAMCGS